MSGTSFLTVELPTELVRLVERKVAAGEFASESDVVRESLETFRDAGPSDDWLLREAVAAYQACLEDPTRLRSADEVFGRLEERYRSDMRALGREP